MTNYPTAPVTEATRQDTYREREAAAERDAVRIGAAARRKERREADAAIVATLAVDGADTDGVRRAIHRSTAAALRSAHPAVPMDDQTAREILEALTGEAMGSRARYGAVSDDDRAIARSAIAEAMAGLAAREGAANLGALWLAAPYGTPEADRRADRLARRAADAAVIMPWPSRRTVGLAAEELREVGRLAIRREQDERERDASRRADTTEAAPVLIGDALAEGREAVGTGGDAGAMLAALAPRRKGAAAVEAAVLAVAHDTGEGATDAERQRARRGRTAIARAFPTEAALAAVLIGEDVDAEAASPRENVIRADLPGTAHGRIATRVLRDGAVLRSPREPMAGDCPVDPIVSAGSTGAVAFAIPRPIDVEPFKRAPMMMRALAFKACRERRERTERREAAERGRKARERRDGAPFRVMPTAPRDWSAAHWTIPTIAERYRAGWLDTIDVAHWADAHFPRPRREDSRTERGYVQALALATARREAALTRIMGTGR